MSMISEYRVGLAFSALVHIGVVTVSVVGIPFIKRDIQPDTPISVEIITEYDEIDRVKEQPQPKSVPETKQAEVPTQQEYAPREVATTEGVPPPDVKPQKKPDPPEDADRRRILQSVVPNQKPKPPQLLNTNKIAALIDRSAQETVVQTETVKEPEIDPEEAARQTRLAALEAERATASIVTMIQQQMRECWNVPAGARDAEDLIIPIRIFLNPDGNLARPPQFLDADRMYKPGQEFYTTAAESAARAVRLCAPFKLPADKYDLWKDLTLNFDPREMLGSTG